MPFLRPNSLRASSSIAILAVAAALASCRGGQGGNDADANQAADPVVNAPAVPLPEPAMDRAGLLAAVAAAASAAALGTDDTAEQRRLDGRQFEIRIRFGCRGPSEDLPSSWLGWAHDEEKNTLRVRAKPTVSIEDPMVAAIGGEDVEAIEGFWIPRPWLMQAACPAAVPTAPAQPDAQAAAAANAGRTDTAAGEQPAEPVPTAPRVGIAQFFTSADPRTARRDNRAYESVKALKADEAIAPGGFDLVLSGRLRALPGREVINCTAKSFDQPPECLVSANFDRVRIEHPQSREVIAEWRAQ